jgi:hypothetical protein
MPATGSASITFATPLLCPLSCMMRRPTVDGPVASGNDWGNDWGNDGFFFKRNWNSQPANRRPRGGQYYQPMQQRWW